MKGREKFLIKFIMKPWQINIILIIGVVIILGLIPEGINTTIAEIIVAISAIWTYFDAKKIEIKKYKKSIFSPSTTPIGAATIVLIMWPIAFPLYISFRQRIKDGKIPLK